MNKLLDVLKKMVMTASFVRGNVVSVIRTDVHGVKNKGLIAGDTLKVGGRKRNGWLRVKCKRTGDLVTIRAGKHLCLFSEASRPVSQIDLLIRGHQVMTLEERAEKAENEVRKLQNEHCLRRSFREREDNYNIARLKHSLDQRNADVARLEKKIEQLLTDSNKAALAYQIRLSELERCMGLDNKYDKSGQGDFVDEEDDWCHMAEEVKQEPN